MTARIEMILWPHYTTGSIEFRVGPGDPWTEVSFTTPLPVIEALDELATQINAARSDVGEVMAFVWNAVGYENKIRIDDSSGALELRLNACMAYLLGFSSLTPIADDASDLVPAGIASLAIVSRSIPREKEERELEAISAGRALTYGYGRATRINLAMTIDAARWETLRWSQLCGYSAIKVTWDNEDPYGEDDLDGYIIAYPTGRSVTDRGNGYTKTVRLDDAVMCDIGEQPFAGQGTAWSNFWGATRYGYHVQQWIQIEGVPLMLGEWQGDAIAPSGYSLEAGNTDDETERNRGLILDATSRIGCALDEKTHFAKAFDQEYRLFASPITDALFRRPTRMAELAADVDADDTTFPVKATTGWGTSGDLYIGPSLETYNGRTSDAFTSVSRGDYGRARSFKKGTLIWDGPKDWRGRRVERFAVLVDPSGRYVQGADVLSDAIMLGAGYIDKRPYRDGPTWRLDVRDQVRRLSQPLGVAASGSAKWSLHDDSLRGFDPEAVLGFRLTGPGALLVEEFQLRPLQGLTSPATRSQIMAAIVEAVDAERGIAGSQWLPRYADGTNLRLRWQFIMPVDVTDADIAYVLTDVTAISGSVSNWAKIDSASATTWAGEVGVFPCNTNLFVSEEIERAGLAVVLDTGAASDLPTNGFILLEGDGNAQHLHYVDLTVDPVDASVVNVVLDTNSEFTGENVQRVADSIASGNNPDVSVKFYWRDQGSVQNTLRRAIVSTGDGIHGFWDQLARGQGLALPYLDAGSFDRVFDEHFVDLRGFIASESGTTLEELFSGILRLSQRGVAAARSDDGTQVQIRAINTGSTEGYPKVTITDQMLVAGGGKRPIREVSVYDAPQRIEVKCRTVAIADKPEGDAVINCIQQNLVDFTNTAWKLDVYGFARRDLIAPAKSWGNAWARSGENRQVLEVDIPPWYDIQCGDTIHLNVRDVQAFDYAVGEDGVDSLARVIGSQLSRTSVQTITVVLDGVLSPGPMSPSLPISAINGTATSPTSIDLPEFDAVTGESIYGLLTYARGGNTSWKVIAYLPVQDTGHAEYTISTVTLPGGSVARLTVTASPSSPTITLTTAHRITWPVSAESTNEQRQYLHADQMVQWS
jgi:hypothetical protein